MERRRRAVRALLPGPLVEHWRQQAPHLRTELVDANHYTILLGDRAAATLAQRITDPTTWPDH